MLKPDYRNSIVNLVASLQQIGGGATYGYDSLPGLEVAGQPMVLLIVDGLGDLFLQGQAESFLLNQRQSRLTSVFPSTTAAAITSFFTGVASQQHAITGWHTYFKELGTVATVLPFIPRFRGASFSEAGIMPEQLLGQGSLFAGDSGNCHVILPAYLADSAYSKALSGQARRHGFGNMADMFTCLQTVVDQGGVDLVICYWPELDSLGHEFGMTSSEVAGHFDELDEACRHYLPRLARAGATVFVTADHGLIDTGDDFLLDLEDHPELASTLTLPLCGEPRCAYCYVRPGREQVFEAYVQAELGHACELRRSRELIRQGYWGLGEPSPRLAERVGDYVLLMKGNYIIKDRLIGESQFHQKGVHGGLSPEELYVPLIVVK